MTILFTRFPLESAYGGAEIQTISLMEGLRARGHDVRFLGSCPVLLRLCKERGKKKEELHIGAPPVRKGGAVIFLWRQVQMKKKLEKAGGGGRGARSPDAIFMLSLSEKLLLTQILKHSNTRIFWIEHDRVGRWLTTNPWLPRLRLLSRGVTTVVVSNLSRKIYEHLGWDPVEIVVIPNGVTRPPAAGAPERRMEQTLRVGCIARLSRDKGVDLLVEAVSRLDDVQLEILGKGQEEGNIRKQIGEAANRHIRLTAFVNDIEDFYSRIDLLVLPSRVHDPFGLSAAEAMMRGIPVIVTDACGIASHLEPGRDAFVVPAGSAEALRNAIAQLKDGGTRERLSRTGRDKAKKEFSDGKMAERYENLLPPHP